MLSKRFQLNLLALIVAEILAISLTGNEISVFSDFMYTLLSCISSPATKTPG